MATTEDYLMAAAFTLIGGFVFFLGFYKWRKLRVIRDTPSSKIRSMAMGVVEIHGSVEADKLIQSPFSKTECVYNRREGVLRLVLQNHCLKFLSTCHSLYRGTMGGQFLSE